MRFVATAIIAAALLAGGAARAQFYDLDGAYRCLTQPDDACAARQRDQPPPKPPEIAPAKKAEAAAQSFADIVARVRQEKATPADIAQLESRAAAKDPRALEVLAWCKLNGIGTPADSIAAYTLYGEAADLGVANARRNQITIYETRLSPEQRQQVLQQGQQAR